MARRISRQSVALFVLLIAPAFAQQAVLDAISADSLRGHLSFLASDTLQGRATPSPGLDLAAEYIAAQFRRAGLEPANGASYLQTTTNAELARPLNGVPPEAKMSNVAGILRGSDPVLRDTYVIVSAHYDHVGLAREGDDLIFNGANDDASGTVSVIELAWALAKQNPRPARSILFMTFFGEERGLLGSRYYGAHPLVPLARTLAQLNLEQIGRTDASNGPQVNGANLTGWDFTNMPEALTAAAAQAGVRLWKDAALSDRYFGLSDNQALADLGIPAHTLSVAYQFPDYHKVSDHWDKIDYDNMARVNRGIALGLLRLASNAPPPEWNAAYPAAQRYAEAAQKLRSSSAVE